MNAINTHLTGESVHEHNDAAGCRLMWLSVLERAFIDATSDSPQKMEQLHQREAHNWISRCGKDFRTVCDMAGMDADFLSEAYNAGRVDPAFLRSAEPARTAPGFERGELVTAVLNSIKGEMTTAEVSEAIRAKGYDVTSNQVSNSLRQASYRGAIKRRKERNLAIWSKVEVNA